MIFDQVGEWFADVAAEGFKIQRIEFVGLSGVELVELAYNAVVEAAFVAGVKRDLMYPCQELAQAPLIRGTVLRICFCGKCLGQR